jgi:hypothetical protein
VLGAEASRGIDDRRHSTQHFVFGLEDERAAAFHAWPFDPPATHGKPSIACNGHLLSISISAR